MAERLPPTPSPTSCLRPGLPPKQAPAAQPGGRVREPAAPARAWRQPRPGGTEPPRQNLRVWTPSGDLPKITLGIPSPGGHWLTSPGHAGDGHRSCPTGSLPARHGLPHHAERAPKPSLQPRSIRRHSHPQRWARTRRPQPGCCVRVGDPVAGHGRRSAGRGRMQLGQCSFLRRWPGKEGREDAFGLSSGSPAPGRATTALAALRGQPWRRGRCECGRGQAESPPRLPASPRARGPGYTQEAALVLSTTRRVNKHPAFNCCHAQTCLTAPGLCCHLPPRVQHLLRASAPHKGQQGIDPPGGSGLPVMPLGCARGWGPWMSPWRGSLQHPAPGTRTSAGSSLAEPCSSSSRHRQPRK